MDTAQKDQIEGAIKKIRSMVLALKVLKASPPVALILNQLRSVDQDVTAILEVLSQMQAEIERLKKENAGLKGKIAQQNSEIDRLNDEIDKLKERIMRLSSKSARNGL